MEGHAMTGRRTFAIVLAGGDGTRLSGLTTTRAGVRVPKQFCSLAGGATLLRQTLERAEALVPRDRIVVVVSQSHREWWRVELADLPRENVVVQPANRGTAAGILVGALAATRRAPDARLLVLPSDHHVGDERPLRAAFRRALEAVEREPARIALLGITPDAPDSQYGWILPCGTPGPDLRPIELFVEKPPVERARELLRHGGLWSSFLFACRASALLDAFEATQPELVRAFLADSSALASGRDLGALYGGVPQRDFSRDVLEKVADRLGVVTVPSCGWSDLGTPERVATVLARRGARLASARRTRVPNLSLALAHASAAP
jgi:mannose-1-phosphate guanylyltransferase